VPTKALCLTCEAARKGSSFRQQFKLQSVYVVQEEQLVLVPSSAAALFWVVWSPSHISPLLMVAADGP
jgi:hypothetical protein